MEWQQVNRRLFSDFFRWSQEKVDDSPLTEPFLIEGDDEYRPPDSVIRPAQKSIGQQLLGSRHRLLTSIRPGRGLQLASQVDALLEHIESEILLCPTQAPAWVHNRERISVLARRFYTHAGAHPALCLSHRSAWSRGSIFKAYYDTRISIAEREIKPLARGSVAHLFIDSPPVALRPESFWWHPADGVSELEEEYYLLFDAQDALRVEGDEFVTMSFHQQVGVGRPDSVLHLAGDVVVAPAAAAETTSLWVGDSGQPILKPTVDVPPGADDHVGFIGRFQPVRFWRSYQRHNRVMADILAFEVHTETGELIRVDAETQELGAAFGSGFLDSGIGRTLQQAVWL